MTTGQPFGELLSEFERVGVDPAAFPAGIAVRHEDAMRILQALPDGAGPGAFLGRVREMQQASAESAGGASTLDEQG